MASSVFNSFIKSVYAGGSSVNFFDSIQGGNEDFEIFGGVNPAEILDEIEGFNTKKATKKEESDSESDSESEEEDKQCTKVKPALPEESIIGYIQIGIHTTPIVNIDTEIEHKKGKGEVDGGVEEDLFNVFGGVEDIVAPMNTSLSNEEDLTAPIDIELCPKKVKTDAKSIGDTLKKLTSS